MAGFVNTATTPLGVAVSDRIAISVSGARPAISAAMQDANKIDEQMRSALEKAEQELDAADTGMWLGVVGGLISGADAGAGTVPQHSEHVEVTPSPLSLARMIPAGGLHAAAVGTIDRHADSEASESSRQDSTTKDHASRMKDAITDLLRKMSAMSDSSRALGWD
jgi:hypothetical protein